jgi:hypothetical protein
MRRPRLFKPESIANVQIEIQIVDTHESLETRSAMGLQAFDLQLNRTLLSALINFAQQLSCEISND